MVLASDQVRTSYLKAAKGEMALSKWVGNGRIGWLVCFTVLLFAASSMLMVADPAGGDQPAETSAQTEEALAEATQTAQEEEREHVEWLLSSEAIQQREASQGAFSSLSPDEAHSLLLEVFSEQLTELNADPARVLSELEIEKPLGTYGARIAAGDGESAIIESAVPVQSELGGDGNEPVDLALERSGPVFVPQNPLTKVELPGSASERIKLHSGIEVELPASGDQGSETLGDKNLFIPETETATDTLIAPIAGGVEVFEQLRSPESPEEFRFPFSLPQGAKVQESAHGAEVLSSSGDLLEEVSAPTAIDAQGTEVPVTMSVEGDALVIGVAHKSSDVAYPLLLDPRYNEGYEAPPLNVSWAPNPGPYSLGNSASSLLAYSQGNSVSYAAGTWGQWEYNAPGETVYIENASFSPIYFYVNNCFTPEPHGYVGIYNVNSGAYNSLGIYSNGNISGASYFAGSGGVGTRKAIVGISTNSASKLKCAHEMWVGGVTVQENDPDKPVITEASGIPSGWFDPGKAGNATIAAVDAGFGVDLITMANAGAGGSEDHVGCTGMWNSRCPRERKWTIAPPYKQGERQLRVSAEDPTGKVGEWTTTTKVDATKPEVELSGQLGNVVEKAESEGEVAELKLPVYNLHIKATDGNEKVAIEKQSGMKNIEIKLDGVKQSVPWSPIPSCPASSCKMEKDFPLTLAGVTSGLHKLTVIASDQIDLVREEEMEFEYFPATGMKDEYVMQHFPLPDTKANEEGVEGSKQPELAVNVTNGNLVYHQSDVEVEGPAVNLEVERFYNSQLPKAASTEWGQGWTLAQTPELELAKAGSSPAKAPMVRTSGIMQGPVGLPTEDNQKRFDAKLGAVVTKEPGGGYEIADESGKTNSALVFDDEGKVTEERTPGYAKVEYAYEGGDLSEITVDDPASSNLPPRQTGDTLSPPSFGFSFGAPGTGESQFSSFGGIATDAAGYVYVADSGGHRVEKFDPDGVYVGQFGKEGAGNGQFGTMAGVAIGPEGSVYVADSSNKRIEKFNSNGGYVSQFGKEGTGDGQFAKSIGGIAVDGAGNVYASDPVGKRILKFSAAGQYVSQIADPSLTNPHAIAVNAVGELWAVDWADERVEKFSAAGTHLVQFSIAGSAHLSAPRGIAVDEETGDVWVTDTEEGRVVGYSPSGAYLGQFGTEGTGEGQLIGPDWPAVDAHGDFYVADPLTLEVQKWMTPAAPSAKAEAASSVVEASATLNAAVNPEGLETKYRLEWGPTTAYGNSLPTGTIGDYAKTVNFSTKVEGLKPWVLYHYRVAATNAEGTTYSQDQQFTTWGEWSLESPPLPKASTSSALSDVSCTSTVSCVGVGYDNYTGRMLGETWNGTQWTLTTGTADQNPTSVSCGSGASCWAVGTRVTGVTTEALVERWESWEPGEWERYASTKPIVPEGATNLRLSGISCNTATECTAVGYYTKESQNQPLAERLVANKWTVQTMPSAAGSWLTDLSCSSPNACVAIGYKQVKGVGIRNLSMRWNGTEWSTLTSPAPKVEGWSEQRLTSISCPTSTSCKATGSSTNEEGESIPYALSYNGSEWSLASLPSLKVGSSLASVSCTSATACLAVGQVAEGGTLAVGWNGSAWTLRSSLTPKEKTALLAGVSCVGSLSCTTVGKQVGGGETTPLAERVGEIWTLEAPPLPKASNSSGLADVSCASALSCVAVGTDNYATRGLGETWDGENWTLVNGTDNTSPTSVSCGSVTKCWAVGTKGTSTAPEILVEYWESEGGPWYRGASTKPVVPEGATNPRLSGISCNTATECTAVGYYTSKESQIQPLAERLVGTKWTVQTMPVAPSSWLTDLSCSSANFCVAIGYKQVKGVGIEGLSMRWNGTEWSALTAPKPAEAYEWRLSSVSCTSAASCIAVGYMVKKEGESFPVAFSYDGNVWSQTTLPTIQSGSLSSVSCAAAGNCLAVGHAAAGGTLAVGWSGTGWNLRTSPSPKGKTSTLLGVSCLAPMACTSVGQSTGSGEMSPLAERVELRNQEATTVSATSVTPSTATLNAIVNPHGLSTKYSFEYGPTSGYGSSAPAPFKEAGSGVKDVAVSNPISGLEAGRIYHFRLVATSEVGTTYGRDKTFTTPPPSYGFAFGSYGSGEGQFLGSSSIATDAEGNTYVADSGNHRVVKFDSRGNFAIQFGQSQITKIGAIAVGPEGYVYIADWGQRKIERFKGNGEFVSQFGEAGTGNGQFGELIRGLAVDKGGVIWVSDSSNHRIERFDSTGKFLSKFGTEGSGTGEFALPSEISIDGSGYAWIVDYGHERVEEFNPAGIYQRQFGKAGKGFGELSHIAGLAIDAANNLWVADMGTHRVSEWNSQGEYLSQFGETGTGEAQLYQPSGLTIDPQGSLLILNDNREVQKWFVISHDAPSDPKLVADDDPSVDVATSSGLVESVEGDDVGEVMYAHSGQMLTAVNSAAGETKYEYDSAERMTKVTLPNGTWGKVEYESLGRVKAVGVSIEGAKAKTTYFSYQDEPSRRTTVTPESEPVTTYDIGADGSVFKWQNAVKPPEIEQLTGSLYVQRGEVHPEPITIGDQTLLVQAHSPEGISSIQIVANGNQIVAEKTCAQEPEKPGTECVSEAKELITNTEAWAPGVLQLEVIVTDRLNQVASQRFWDNIPYTPPPDSEAPDPPKFAEVLRFREEFGLDLDLKGNEFALNERIFELISLWHNPNTSEGEVARATADRWGVPLRAVDAAELEYRERYLAADGPLIEQWAEMHARGAYAGFYMDNRQGGIIHVGFSNNPWSRLEALKREVPLVAADRITAYESRPEHSLGQLYGTLHDFNSRISSQPALAELLTTTTVNVRANTVTIGTTNVAPIATFISNNYGPAAPLVATYDPSKWHPAKTFIEEGVRARPNGSDRLFGGDWIRSSLSDGGCTLAFGAYEKVKKTSSGTWLFNNYGLTAGHCWPVGTTVYRGAFKVESGKKVETKVKIGEVERRSKFHNVAGYEIDSEAIHLTASTEVPKWIYWNSGYQSQINGAEAWKPGETLCYAGAWGGVHCGPSGASLVEGSYIGGERPVLEIEVKTYSEDGSSGSPVWNPRTGAAVATLVGGPDLPGTEHSGPNGPTFVTPILPVKTGSYIEEEESDQTANCEREFFQEAAEEGESITREVKEEAELLCEDPAAQEKAEEGVEVFSIPPNAQPGLLGAPTMDSPHRLTIVDPVK